jgi:multisubunit Na+/H+ antiporter MnhB subunit
MAEIGHGGLSIVSKTVARWIKGFILVFGIYLLAYGHLTPGGGFAGGVMMSLAFVLVTLCCGKRESLRMMPLAVAGELDSVGALMFLVIAVLGISAGLGGSFFTNYIAKAHPGTPFSLLSAGIIPLCNLAIAIKVASSLFLVFMVLVMVRVVHSSSEDEPQ